MGTRNDGRPDRRHVTGRTEKIVTGKVQALERQRSAGHVANSGRAPTVADWLTHWLDNIAAAKVRPSTLAGYRTYVEGRLIPGLGAHRLDRLQPEHIERLYRDLRADGMAPASVLQCHRTLFRALKVAVQRGRVARNVCTLVDAPSVQRHEVDPLTAEDARRILAAATAGRNAARWSVALALGLRQGEALGLRWSDVDLDVGTLAVRQALQRLAGQGIVFVPPKSRAGRRTILLPVELLDALREHQGAQNAERTAAANLGRTRAWSSSSPRPADRPERGPAGVEAPVGARRCPSSPSARCEAHGGDPASAAGRPGAGRHGDPRSLSGVADSQRLQPRHAGAGDRGRGRCRRSPQTGYCNEKCNRADIWWPNMRPSMLLTTGGAPGDRTRNPRIKSPLLCQLS